MKRLLAFAFVLCLGSPLALAQPLNMAATEPTFTERAKMDACLDQAQANGEDMNSCINLATRDCDRLSTGNTRDIVECYSRELGYWDDILNVNYKALRAGLSEKKKIELRDIQRTWIGFRDDSCLFQYSVVDGTIAQIFFAACQNRTTAQRALTLYTMVEWAHGDQANWVRDQNR